MQRETCPLIGCEISFIDPDTMLQHVYSCPYMSGGLYRCYKCCEEVVIGTYHNRESFCGQLRLDMRATIANSIKNLRVSSKAHKRPSRHNQQKSDGLENEADDGYGVESEPSSQTVSNSFNEYSPTSNAQWPHIEPHRANNFTTELDSYDILELPDALSPSAEIVSYGLDERSQSSKSPWFDTEQYPYSYEMELPGQFPAAELSAGPPHAVLELEGEPENTIAGLPASQCPPHGAALKPHTSDSFSANSFSTIRSNRQNQHYLDLRPLPQPQYNLSMEALLFAPDITMITSQQFPSDLYITSTTDMELTSAGYANQASEIVSGIGSHTHAEPLDLSSSENNSAIVLTSKGMSFSSSAESSPCTETVSTEDLGTCASPRQLQHDGSSPFLNGMDFSGSPTSNSNEISQSAFQDNFQGSSFSNAPPLMHHKNNAVAPDESLHTISPSRLCKNSATTSTGTPLPSTQQSFSQELLSPAARYSAQDNPDSPPNESLYRCQCGYTPTGKLNNKKSNLKRHKKTCKLYSHLYNRPHKCLFLGCGKTYSRSDGLLNHERKHKHGPVSFQIGSLSSHISYNMP
ncbi:hypothetical protein B0O99DRAFT_5837 [Bisporella sp. PMI_857]|nr:hypothetical protein B0O99DRAFT_5837 [Bisporella sp. PMI_857]